MPKQMLSGTLDEQCAFLYQLASEKAAVGNYSGATHALKEILKHKPAYPGARELMASAMAGRRQQRFLLWFSLAGAIGGVFAGTLLSLSNDLWLLAMAAVGGLVGFGVGNLFAGRPQQMPLPPLVPPAPAASRGGPSDAETQRTPDA